MAPPPNLDRVQAVKWESSAKGGTDEDSYPVGMDETADALSARGLYGQPSGGPADEDVLIWRDGSDWKFQDKNTGPLTLAQLSAGGGITESQHKTLPQLIHFISEGPFASAYREALPSGNLFPTSIIWWTDSDKTQKIVELLITWSGAVPSQMVWKSYDSGGVLVETVTDTPSYTGIIETTRTRTVS
jgi:hypothetical protein